MENSIKFISTVTGRIQTVHPDFVNDKRWLASHNLVRHTEPTPAQVTNLIPEQKETEKEIIDYSEAGGQTSFEVDSEASPTEPTPAPKKSNSKTK